MQYYGASLVLAWRGGDGWQVLLGRRNFAPCRGCWSVPGGRREHWDADARATACRETAEEVLGGRSVEEFFGPLLQPDFSRALMPEHAHYTPSFNPWRTYLVRLGGDELPAGTLVVPNAEFGAAAWFPVRHLPTPVHPCVIDSLRHFGLFDPTGAPAGP